MKSKNLTLNPNKCTLGCKEIKFLGMLFSSEKVKPETEKNRDLEDIEPPKNKKELKWFIYMIQSNTDSIPYFSKSVAPLRIRLNGKERFKWTTFDQNVVHNFLQEFTLLTYFDINKKTLTFTDAHKTDVSEMLAQGEIISNAKTVAIVSRSTSKVEQNYALLDLKSMTVNYALHHFYALFATRTCHCHRPFNPF